MERSQTLGEKKKKKKKKKMLCTEMFAHADLGRPLCRSPLTLGAAEDTRAQAREEACENFMEMTRRLLERLRLEAAPPTECTLVYTGRADAAEETLRATLAWLYEQRVAAFADRVEPGCGRATSRCQSPAAPAQPPPPLNAVTLAWDPRHCCGADPAAAAWRYTAKTRAASECSEADSLRRLYAPDEDLEDDPTEDPDALMGLFLAAAQLERGRSAAPSPQPPAASCEMPPPPPARGRW